VITTYFQSEALHGQATALLAMMLTSLTFQLIFGAMQYSKKSFGGKLYEACITLFFLRPAVDAYRISTNHVDADAIFDPMAQAICNKVSDAKRPKGRAKEREAQGVINRRLAPRFRRCSFFFHFFFWN